MVWGSGGREFLSSAAAFTPSTKIEVNFRLRKTNSNIGKRIIQPSIGLHVLQRQEGSEGMERHTGL